MLCLLGAAAPASGAERPRVYVVVLDGLEREAVEDGMAPFLASLLRGEGARATDFLESRAIMTADTNPNHVAMATGAYGSASGIPGNGFAVYAPLEGEEDNEADTCVAAGPKDFTQLPTYTGGEHFSCLEAETVFEAILRQGDPDALVTAGIFGKTKLGRIFAGRHFDGRRRDLDYVWAPCPPGATEDELEYCDPTVPVDPATRDRTVSDTFAMDETIKTIREGVQTREGTRERPDLTFVNLPNIDNAGHVFGGGSVSYDTAVGLADEELRRLVTELRAQGLWESSVLLVLSDHGHDENLREVTLSDALDAAGIDPASYLIVQPLGVSILQVYLADRTDPGRFELLRRMRAAVAGVEGVDEALYREENPADGGASHALAGLHPGWNYGGERGGDMVVTAQPGYRFTDPAATGNSVPGNPIPGNHGSPHTLDNFFAVIGGGPLVQQQALSGQVAQRFDDTLLNARNQSENVDVAATVAGLFGLFAPLDSEGRFLGEAFDDNWLRELSAPPAAPQLRLRQVERGSRTRVYRISWAEERRGQYDVAIRRRGGGWRRLQRRSQQTSRRLRLRAGERYVIRVRTRAASGVHSPWSTRSLRVPRRR